MPRQYNPNPRSLDDDILTYLSQKPARYSITELREAAELLLRRTGIGAAMRLVRRCHEQDEGSGALLVTASIMLDCHSVSNARRALRKHHREVQTPLCLDAYALYHEILYRLCALDDRPLGRFRPKLTWWSDSRVPPKPPERD
jgi:hypothetical protein